MKLTTVTAGQTCTLHALLPSTPPPPSPLLLLGKLQMKGFARQNKTFPSQIEGNGPLDVK